MTDIEGGKGRAEQAGSGVGRRGSRWRIAAWSAAALLLLVPLVAMQFSDEVDWSVGDFVFAGALLGGTGAAFELAARRTRNTAYRTAAGVALTAAFILVWLNGAVGIIGSETDDANLMYAGVLAVGTVGALIARFRPLGMARALVVTAVAQALVAVIALAAGWGTTGARWPWDIVVLTGGFVTLWLASAWLFVKAARAGHGGARSVREE